MSNAAVNGDSLSDNEVENINSKSNRPVGSTDIDKELLAKIQKGILRHEYKGILTWKSPVDLAMYQDLICKKRPKTILEFGSKFGGSALWFADMLSNHEIYDGHVYSFDLKPNKSLKHPRITFGYCDVAEPKKHLSDDFMRSLPRPMMVVEDSSHMYEHVLTILNFLHRWVDACDYIIIEDGIVEHLRSGPKYYGGPLKAIREFLSEHPKEYRIDRERCDFYGTNVTWALDGYIQPLNPLRE